MKIEMPKTFEEVQEATLLPADLYKMVIAKEPKVEPNANKRAQEKGEEYDPEKVGDNIILRLRVVHDDHQYNGRSFTKWLSLPQAGDEDNMIEATGQSRLDWKMDQIRRYQEAFSGDVVDPSSTEVSFEQGQVAYIPVIQRTGMNDQPANEIDFNGDPKPCFD